MYDAIPNGRRNACFGHYRQVFHCTSGMKDIYLIGLCSEATIRAAHIVRHKQIQAFRNQFSACIICHIAGFSRSAAFFTVRRRPEGSVTAELGAATYLLRIARVEVLDPQWSDHVCPHRWRGERCPPRDWDPEGWGGLPPG